MNLLDQIPVDVAISFERKGDKYCVVSHNVYAGGELGIIKGLLGEFDDPATAVLHYQIFSDPLFAVTVERMCRHDMARVMERVRHSLYFGMDAASVLLRKTLGIIPEDAVATTG